MGIGLFLASPSGLDQSPLGAGRVSVVDLVEVGRNIVRLPARSPNLNAYAERFVLSIKAECLERMVPLGEWHLRRTISEYMRHYHLERNHQGLDNTLIDGISPDTDGIGPVARGERLGGLLNFYYRQAA